MTFIGDDCRGCGIAATSSVRAQVSIWTGSSSIDWFNGLNCFRLGTSSGLAGDAGLTKTGAGTLVINSDNTFTGETIVADGTL